MTKWGHGIEQRPTERLLAELLNKLGLTAEAEIHAGHQSRTFMASRSDRPLVVKMINPSDAGPLTAKRAGITRQLSAVNQSVVGPIEHRSTLVNEINGWQVICYPHIDGTDPDTTNQADVETMATTLATLHRSMRALEDNGLKNRWSMPPVAALGDHAAEVIRPGTDRQLIHGDFAAANLIVTEGGFRVIDFDDCGRGTVEFELGNSLYMMLFDSWNAGEPDRYHRFRSWFLDAYRQAASAPVDDQLVDRAIEIRTATLRRWLTNPDDAPPGIRNADRPWRQHLKAFVDR